MLDLAAAATEPQDLAGLADEVGTPAYVYDLTELRDNHAALRRALPTPATLYYSLKANPHPALLRTLRQLGALPEVSSTGELHSALDAGWVGEQVLYTGPGKADQEVREALGAGVRTFSVDSPTGLDQLDRHAEGHTSVRALLRINDDRPSSGQGLAMTGVASQFGADASWVLAEPDRFTHRRAVEVAGLHLYMGTNLGSESDLLSQFRQSARTAAEIDRTLRRHGVRLRVLDLGGGFGAPYAQHGRRAEFTTLRHGLDQLLDDEMPGWRQGRPTVAFESGRYLTSTTGALLVRVMDVKRSHGKNIAVLESGINHLGGMPGLRRLPPPAPDLTLVNDDDRPPTTSPTAVTGPLCTPLDSWSRNATLPDLHPGDVLAVPNVGAYGLYASLVAFLGHRLPIEIVTDRERTGFAPTHTSRLHLTRDPS